MYLIRIYAGTHAALPYYNNLYPDGEIWNTMRARSISHTGAAVLIAPHFLTSPHWRDMLDGRFKNFPERVLVDAKTTIGQLLGVGAQRAG